MGGNLKPPEMNEEITLSSPSALMSTTPVHTPKRVRLFAKLSCRDGYSCVASFRIERKGLQLIPPHLSDWQLRFVTSP